MIIVYIGYWSSGDVLTQSVIVPRLTILSELPEIEEIVFCSIERTGGVTKNIAINKVQHLKFFSKPGKNVLKAKFYDFSTLPSFLQVALSNKEVSFILCNSPLAGAIGYFLSRKIKSPYWVECFEPHSAYMLESGVWKWYDPRYIILRFFEWRQKQTASKLLTVSAHYTERLSAEGVDPEKIVSMPNGVALQRFQFDNESRKQIRISLGITNEMQVGIYVGKFGDIYYDDEAFDLFAAAFNFFGESFYLIVLSGQDNDSIKQKFLQRGISLSRVYVAQVPNPVVANYLSAADFAFATIKPAPCRLYCCPIKNGEYWANGLPILVEDGIGDDSDIIKNEGGGFLLDMKHPEESFRKIETLLRRSRTEIAAEIQPIAYKHRRLEIVKDTYQKIIASLLKTKQLLGE